MESRSQSLSSLPLETEKTRQPNETHESLSLENYQQGSDHNRIEAKSRFLEAHVEHEIDNNENDPNCSTSNTHQSTHHEGTAEEEQEEEVEEGAALHGLPGDGVIMEDVSNGCAEALQEDGRERLKRHRIEVAGRVWIPDIWGQEELLKDWIDCSAFDASLVPNGIMSARAALVVEGSRANSRGLRIANRC